VSDVVRFEQVTRVHGTGRGQVTALNGVSLTVAPGELVAVMGPSGSGKSTLLTLAGGLDHPTSGRVVVDGEDLAVLGPRDLARLRRRAIGYVFQELNLLPQLTAAENVMLPLELDGVPHAEAVRDARRALEAVGMLSLEDRFPDDLSGGERQRTAIARAIVGPRRLLLADEPTGALDSLNGEAILRLLHDHCGRGGSAIVVTHDARHAAWADRVVFLRDGRVVDQAGPMPGPEVLLLDGGRA
jgi:putative ABC transport system ATP-binding protein